METTRSIGDYGECYADDLCATFHHSMNNIFLDNRDEEVGDFDEVIDTCEANLTAHMEEELPQYLEHAVSNRIPAPYLPSKHNNLDFWEANKQLGYENVSGTLAFGNTLDHDISELEEIGYDALTEERPNYAAMAAEEAMAATKPDRVSTLAHSKLCGAKTAEGVPCERHVAAGGSTCYQH